MYSARLQLLLDIYTAVSTACFDAAAKAVVSYTDHLKTLQGLETITESSCPSCTLFIINCVGENVEESNVIK